MKLADIIGKGSEDSESDEPDPLGDDAMRDMYSEELAEALGVPKSKGQAVADLICRIAKLEAKDPEGPKAKPGKKGLALILGK